VVCGLPRQAVKQALSQEQSLSVSALTKCRLQALSSSYLGNRFVQTFVGIKQTDPAVLSSVP